MKPKLVLAVTGLFAITGIYVGAQSRASQQTASGDRWRTSIGKAPMDDSETITLTLTADAPIRVWLKTVTPTLILRCKEKSLDTYVVTESAANVESGDNRTVRLRFDSAPAEVEFWGQATDNKALFAPEPEEFLDRLRKTNRLLFQFIPFNAAPVVVAFSTHGLNAKAQRLMKGCPEATRTKAQRKEVEDQRKEAETQKGAAAAKVEADRLAERKRTNPLTEDLIGLSDVEVKQRIGEPHYINDNRWTFDLASGGELIVFMKDGRTSAVNPVGIPLSSVRRQPPLK